MSDVKAAETAKTIAQPLDKRTKWSYCVGATGRDMAYALVSMYLITYIQYTMKLTVAQYGAISAILVVCLIWDAINDPMMGIIIENARFKSGKYRPWILLGVILNAIVIVMLFTLRPEGWAFVIFFGISYLCWGMTFTMNDISYWGLLPSLSSDPKERNSLVSLMSIFCCVGQFAIAGVIPIVVAGNAVNAYRIAALVVALCFLAFQLLTFFGVKERKRSSENEQKKLSLKDMFKIFLRNDQLVVAGIACLLFNIGNGLLILLGMNFFYFEFGYSEGGNLIFMFTVMYGVGTLISQGCYATIARKFTRRAMLRFLTFAIIVSYFLFLITGRIIPQNPIILYAEGFLIFFFQGLFNMNVVVMLNNTIEYDEYRFKERHDSIISAVRSFAVKLSSAINQGIQALILIISGIYAISQNISALEVEKGKGLLSSEEVLASADSYIQTATSTQKLILRIGITLIPVLVIVTADILLKKKYKIDEVEYKRLVKEIEERQ
ncbi:MAG: MFS transporter [Spirochaetaceae bacterium]|nr:MFS transporter [Spirochaetaceae bacterium]